MIGKLFDKIESAIQGLMNDNSKVHHCAFWGAMLTMIKTDRAELEQFLDGEGGHINYYSPHVVKQLKYKDSLLERYEDDLYIAQLLEWRIHEIKEEGKLLRIALKDKSLSEDEKKEIIKQLQVLKDELISLLTSSDPTNIIEQADKLRIIAKARDEVEYLKEQQENLGYDIEYLEKQPGTTAQLIQISSMKDELVRLGTELEAKEKELQAFLVSHNKSLENPELKLGKVYSSVTREQLKHLRITQQLPEGLIGVKKALSFLQADPILKISTDADTDQTIKDGLEDLKAFMKKSIQDYQSLMVTGGDINVLFQKCTTFYWQTLRVYRHTLNALCEQLPDEHLLTTQGKEICECLIRARSEVPEYAQILSALRELQPLDSDLSQLSVVHNRRVDEDGTVYTSDDPLDGMRLRFYPNTTKGILNYQLQKADYAQNPVFFMPYSYHSYTLDHPPDQDYTDAMGSCYGETQMFIQRLNSARPTINNICPERELMNYQLDQTRSAGKERDQRSLGEVSLTSLRKDASGAESGIEWDDIKGFLTGPTDSSKNGDVCWLRFGGADVEGKSMSHAMAFIHMKDPNPYKYVVYTYDLGAVGFSSDEQLESFFKTILPSYVAPFRNFSINKEAEVRDELKSFLSNIKPLEPAIAQSHTPKYWDKDNLGLFIKYHDPNDSNAWKNLQTIMTALEQIHADQDLKPLISQLFKSYRDKPLTLFNKTQSPRIREALQQEAIATKSPMIATLEKIDEAAREQITELAYQVVVKMTQDIVQTTTLPIDTWIHCLEKMAIEEAQKILPQSVNWMRIMVEQKGIEALEQPDARMLTNMLTRVENIVGGQMLAKVSELEALEEKRAKQQSMRTELASPRKEQEDSNSQLAASRNEQDDNYFYTAPTSGFGGSETD